MVVPVNRPFFGTMGLAPDASMGRVGSGQPGVHTGNLDDDLIAGTTLYMPVHALAHCSPPATRTPRRVTAGSI